MQAKKQQNDLCSFPRQAIQYHSNPSLCPDQYAEEAEAEQFYEDLQGFLELTPKKDVFFIIGGEGNDIPLQYSCLKNPMDREAW